MRHRGQLVWMVMLLLAGSAQALGADLRGRVEALTQGGADRGAGSQGANRNADYLAEQLAAVTGEPVRRQGFLLALPVVEVCRGTDQTAGVEGVPGGAAAVGSAGAAGDAGAVGGARVVVPLAPLLPSGGQIAALSAEQRASEVLYVGRGTLEELRGKELADRLVVLDISSDALAWQRAASLGARAIVFLGEGKTTASELLNKSTSIPLGIPRFYCDDADAVARLKHGAIKSLAIEGRAGWREKRLENLFCFIPGSVGPEQYIILQARYDGSSQVLGRAPGASQAVAAAALVDLAQRIAAAPKHASVLLVLTAGDEWNLRGTRAALDLLNPEFKDAKSATDDLRKQAAAAEGELKNARAILAGINRLAERDFAALADAHTRLAVEDQLLRESSRVEEQLQRARLALPQDAGVLASLQSQKEGLLSAMSVLLPRAGRSRAQELKIQSAARDVRPRWQTQVRRLAELRDVQDGWAGIRSVLGDKTPMLFLSLALSSGSSRYGFFARSSYSPALDFTGKTFAQAFRRYAPAAAAGEPSGFVAESTEKRFTLESFFPVAVAFSSDAALARGIPGGAFATVGDALDFLDTPNDLAERLNYSNLHLQEQSLIDLLVGSGGSGAAAAGGALTDPAFYVRNELNRLTADQPVTLFERTIGESLPRLAAANCLLGGETEFAGRASGPPLAGTRRQDWYLTYADGTATFTSTFRFAKTRLAAFDFDAAGQPTRTLAGNQAEVRGLAADFFPDPSRPLRCMLFESRRLDCYGLFDPRYLDTLDKLEVLDARRLDRAQYSNVYAQDGLAAVFLPPDIRWQLLVAKGALNNRMLLINASAAHPSGIGFDTTDLRALRPLPWRNVLDLEALNGQRQRDLEKFGISSALVKELQAGAQKQIQAARAAEKTRDYPAFFAATDAAWSLESQVYQTLIDTSNGIIKGVIFLLLGIIPFSYFLERLLIAAATIYRQIVGFAGIFAGMTLALWFHPAFRISSAPLMILLAFLILILSSAVVYILWGKFEEEIACLRGSGARGAAHATSLRRAAVLGAAIRLGLSNMRRRGTRTALTLLTLLLLTFTLLCFTSVTESVQVTPRIVAFPPNAAPLPPGILLRQRGWRALPAQALDVARGLALPGPGPIATRWWYSSDKSEEPWLVPVRGRSGPAGVKTFFASALVGLDGTEENFQGVAMESVLPQFSRLGEGAAVCWLPVEAQKAAALAVGDTVDIVGQKLMVAGFFDDGSFRQLRQLTGDPLSAIDPGGASNRASALSNEPQATAAPETSYRFLGASSIAIVPAKMVRKIGGHLTSIMLRPGVVGADAAGGGKWCGRRGWEFGEYLCARRGPGPAQRL